MANTKLVRERKRERVCVSVCTCVHVHAMCVCVCACSCVHAMLSEARPLEHREQITELESI